MGPGKVIFRLHASCRSDEKSKDMGAHHGGAFLNYCFELDEDGKEPKHDLEINET